MNNSFINTKGKEIALKRAYTPNASLSSTEYLPPTKFKVGVNSNTMVLSDTDLTHAVPIDDGTVLDDGTNTLTGSSGGSNSTDNTTRYKPVPGIATPDLKAQNLITNTSNASKIWTVATLSTNATAAQYTGLWIYIKDQTTLDYFLTSGTCLEIKLGSDTSNYYSKTYEVSDLTTGWNWLDLTVLNTNTETGTVSGNIDTFIITITTNNATDSWTEGDVIYDLLRQWEDSDLIASYISGFPLFDMSNLEVEIQSFVNSVQANGFDIDSIGLFNEDTAPLMHSISIINSSSKSNTDEFTFTTKDREL